MFNAPTYGDIVTFVLLNRGTSCFGGMTDDEVERDVIHALKAGTYLYDCDRQGEITSYLQYEVSPPLHTVYVTQNIALSLRALNDFFQWFLQNFPGYELKAMRHGHPVTYNLIKLTKHLSYYGR